MPIVVPETQMGLKGGRHRRWAEWFAVAWIVGYSVFFFHFTLPNSNPPVSRVDVWLELPEILWSNVAPPPKAPASSWSNLPQRLDLFAVAAAIWLGSWAVGSLLLRAMRIQRAGISVVEWDKPAEVSDGPSPAHSTSDQATCVDSILTSERPPTESGACSSQPTWLSALEHLVFSCGLGLSAVSLLMLGCGLAGWMSPWLLNAILVAVLMAEVLLRVRSQRSVQQSAVSSQRSESRRQKRGAWDLFLGIATRGEQIPYDLVAKSAAVVAIGLCLLAMLLGSVLPPTDFDVKAYHLTGPKEYFLNGKITFLSHNVYTNFPFLTEMLCLLGMVLRQDWYWGALAGQSVLMGFAPLTGLALFCAGRRWFNEWVGWLAALIYLTTPWTYRLAIIAYVEGALSCYLFLTLFAVMLAIEALRSEECRFASNRFFLLAGLLAGSAMACKYPGLVSVVLPLGLASGIAAVSIQRSAFSGQHSELRSRKPEVRSLKSVVLTLSSFTGGVALTIGPWLLRNLIETGNPVYPLAYGIFGGRDWDAASHAKWRAGHSPTTYALNDLAQKFVDVTAKADWLSPLLFGLAPFALLAAVSSQRSAVSDSTSHPSPLVPRPLVVYLWIYVAYLFAQWWLLTHRIDRFWVPLIPVVALLAAVGCVWSSTTVWRRACGAFVALSVLFNLGFVTTSLCGFNAYLSDLYQAREGCESTAEGIHYINQLANTGRVPANGTVLCVGEAQVFDARPRVIYNTVFDQPIFRDWLTQRPTGDLPDRDWPLRPIEEIRQPFESHGVTHVLVNWQELLRYRSTYGYSDFVTPKRFRWLQEQGLLGDPAEFAAGTREFASLSKEEQREVERWAPETKRVVEGKLVFVTWEVFPVLARGE